jgi:hypothetical protein
MLQHSVNDNPADLGGLLGSGVFSGFSMQDFQDLQKALEAGHPDPTYEGGGAGWPLITQSIEGSLTYATATEEHCRLWRQIPKDPKRLTSTVHEFSSIAGLGPDTDFSMPEGSAGPLIEADLRRASKYVRFMSHKREISDPMNLLSNLVGGSPAIEQMNQWASTWMVLQLEQNLLWGDSDIHPYSIDGLAKITKDAGHVEDLRGAFLSSDKVYDKLVNLINPPNWGSPTHLWISVDTKADFAKVGGSHVMFNIPPNYAGSQNFKMGIEPIGIVSPLGTTVGFETSVFLSAKGGPAATAIGEVIPTLPVITTTTADDASSLFVAADYGTYKYQLVACGTKGKSAPCAAITAVVDATHKKVVHSVAAPAIDNVLYYTLYRSKKDGSAMYEIRKIKQARDSSGVVTATPIIDMNEDIPDTMSAFIIENTPKAWQWKQLLDFARVALARNEFKQPFGYCLYGMLICYLPMRFYQFKNIGRAESL